MSKIFICGTSGIGKTTLAKHIARSRNTPFINGSSTVLWNKFNIENHKELLELGFKDPQRGLDFQHELLKYRVEITKGLKGFVTDRSPIDNLVYFLYQNAPYLSERDVHQYIDQCNFSMQKICDYNFQNMKLLYLTRDFQQGDTMGIIVNDGKRIDNHYYQDMMDNLFQHVIDKDYLKLQLDSFNYRRYTEYDWSLRKDLTRLFLNRKRNALEQFLRNWL